MRSYKRRIAALLMSLILLLAFSACSNESAYMGAESTVSSQAAKGEPVLPDEELNAADMFTDRDKETGYNAADYVEITLSDAGSTASSGNVKIDGGTVTVSAEGTYVLSGSLSNGQVIVDAADTDKIQLVLKGVSINCDTSAAIYIREADKVFITLDNGTANTLSNIKEFVAIDDNNIDSVIFSKADLTLNGNGSLTVNAAYGHGIVSKDDLVFTGGAYRITSAGHGLEGKDSVRIADGDFTIASGKDGIHAENADDATLGFIYIAGGAFDIKAETDGLDAAASLQIEGGSFTLATGGGSENASTGAGGEQMPGWGRWGQDAADTSAAADTASAKGLKAEGNLLVKAGTFIIDSSDDSLHSNANIYINDGSFTLSSGDDGLHADTKAVINGGIVIISGSYEGIEGQSIDITGGVISIAASDDGLNAAGGNDGSGMGGRPGKGSFTADADCYIKISGGSLTIDASGDGVDSNGNLYVAGGETYVSGSANGGNGAVDYNGSAEVTGGIFVAAGSSAMAQNFGTASTQGAILCNVSNSQSGGSPVTLKDQSGHVILSYAPEKQYNSVVISTPEIKEGASYTLEMGTESQSITMSGLIYGSGGMSGNPGERQPGGGMGGNPRERQP